MVLVKGGRYRPAAAGSTEVDVDALCIDRTEVTADAYARCAKSGTCSTKFLDCSDVCTNCDRFATFGAKNRADHPINCVDHFQAEAYCLSLGLRLPSSAEWEWVARGGAAARKFPWGDEAPGSDVCWSGVNLRDSTCAVGTAKQDVSVDGIVDLAANVAEWTSTADAIGHSRVYRGGMWDTDVAVALEAGDMVSMNQKNRSLRRDWRSHRLGFRCVTAPR